MVNDPNPTETPLLALLLNVPADARLIYEHSPIESQSIPVGRLCAESAAEIIRLRRALEERIDHASRGLT